MMQIAMRIADNSGNTLDVPEYHRDHLGNNRMDVAATGGVHQITHYYPYGMPMDCGYIPAYQRWLFGDKEFDRTSGLDLYDFEARAYDPALGRFRQPDPLAEKYRPLSPYLYCAANPLNQVDPSGMKIVFAESATTEFKNDFNKAWELLKQAGASNNIDYLNSIEAEITIAEGDINSEGPNNFIPKNNTIYWLPKYGINTDKLYFLSPMENLQHEADHGAKYNSDPTTMLKDGEVSDPAFGNREERRVILGSETETAQKLGKLKEGEITRSSHTGVYIKVADVNSTFVDSEFIVTVTAVGSLPKLTPSKIVFPTPSIRMPTTIKINQ